MIIISLLLACVVINGAMLIVNFIEKNRFFACVNLFFLVLSCLCLVAEIFKIAGLQ